MDGHVKSGNNNRKSNREYRLKLDKLENYPSGYLETWSNFSTVSDSSETDSSSNNVVSKIEAKWKTAKTKTKAKTIPKAAPKAIPKAIPHNIDRQFKPKVLTKVLNKDRRSVDFSHVSISLLIGNNIMLNKGNNYEIRFSTGVLEGTGVSVNGNGNVITFNNEGSYQFEICGEAVTRSNVEVSLIYHSDKFSPDVKPFSITKLPKTDDKINLRGISTILPIQRNQNIVVRLVANPDESIVLLEGTRLMIHRVA